MAGNNEKNAYLILGLQKGATPEEIKQTYLTLVKKFDPEKHTERFMEIDRAFQRLRDPVKRAKEDIHSFNFIKGDFFFNKEEMSNAPDPQIEQALQMLERKKEAGELKPEEVDPKLVQGFMIRSYKKVQKKLWAEAIQDWQRVMRLDPTNRRAKNNLLYSFITLGYSYANHGLFDEAVDVWTQAAQMNPDDINIIHNLAIACEKAGRVQEAQRYWQETIKRWRARLERESDNDYLKHMVIEALREHQGEGEGTEQPSDTTAGGTVRPAAPAAARTSAPKGISDYREILRLNPNDFEAQFKIANALMQEHKWDEAISELESLRGKFPRNVEVLNLFGWALLNGGRVDDAFTTWNKAIVIDPKNADVKESMIKARMAMGRMLRDKGQYTPALVHFKALTRILPNNDDVTYEIGVTYHQKGDERQAFQEYNKVLKLNPKHKAARHGLSTLKLRR